MNDSNYELIVIGGGAGGFAAAIKANELGHKVLMINDGLPIGGTCVNVGCVPSKALLWAGEVKETIENNNVKGLKSQVATFNFSEVINQELSLVERMREDKYKNVLSHLPNVTYLKGRAKFISNNKIIVDGKEYTSNKFIIATGSTARTSDIKGLEDVGYLTHIEALKVIKQPETLTIIGGGPVGVEFAQMYSRLGTKVTLLQRSPAILSGYDKELSTFLMNALEKEGIEIKTNVKLLGFEKQKGSKKTIYKSSGSESLVISDEILLAIGKIPNTSSLDLDKAGVNTNEKQAIEVSETLMTSNENIFAVGDVNSLPKRLETTAGAEGTKAAQNALEGTNESINYDHVPYAIFTDPQFAGVGITEQEQMEKLGTCFCRTLSFDMVPKAIIMGKTNGLINMVVNPQNEQIEGIHIVGSQASELASYAMEIVRNGKTLDEVINSIPMFPTLSEAIKITAMSFKKDITKLSCCV